LVGFASAAALFTTGAVVLADEPTFGPYDVPTVFFINKSDDRNRVDYGMRLDSTCAPSEDDPVLPYWREFENSPPVRTHPLGTFEWLAYGFRRQRMYPKQGETNVTLVKLKQVDRSIWIFSRKGSDGHCAAIARTAIAGVADAQLLSIYVKLGGALSVTYIDIKGRTLDTGQLVEERLYH
jgi:hypothetical protein